MLSAPAQREMINMMKLYYIMHARIVRSSAASLRKPTSQRCPILLSGPGPPAPHIVKINYMLYRTVISQSVRARRRSFGVCTARLYLLKMAVYMYGYGVLWFLYLQSQTLIFYHQGFFLGHQTSSALWLIPIYTHIPTFCYPTNPPAPTPQTPSPSPKPFDTAHPHSRNRHSSHHTAPTKNGSLRLLKIIINIRRASGDIF